MKIMSAQDLGKKIRFLRTKAKIKQSQLAKMLNVTTTAIQNYEAGNNYPNLKNLEKLANIFDIPVTYLLYNMDNELIDYIVIPLVKIQVSNKDNNKIEYIPIKSKNKYAFNKQWLKENSSSISNLISTIAQNDLMHSTIQPGDIFLIDKGQKEIKTNNLYLLKISNEITIKRIIKLPAKFKLINDNKTYPEITVSLLEFKAIEVIGTIIWIGKSLNTRLIEMEI